MEPVSPELALIDPDLARADLARTDLVLAGPVLLLPAAARRATGTTVPTARGERRSRRAAAAQILLFVSLAANGFLLANLAADGMREYPVPAAPSPVLLQQATPARGVAAVAETRLREQPTRTAGTTEPGAPIEASAAVEQKILAMVLGSRAGKLPAALADPKTGLPKNNLQAVCRRVSESFLCTVRPAGHRAGEGLHARYRDGSVTWYPYQPG